MANNLSLTITSTIQATDLTTGGSPVYYNRPITLNATLETNFVAQTISLTASFIIPAFASLSYAMVYIKNLMPASSNTILLLNVTIGGSGIAYQLAPGAFYLMGSPVAGNQVPITQLQLSAFSNAYPLLAEYAIAST